MDAFPGLVLCFVEYSFQRQHLSPYSLGGRKPTCMKLTFESDFENKKHRQFYLTYYCGSLLSTASSGHFE